MIGITDQERNAAAQHVPPVVYVPAHRVSGPAGPTLELRELDSGGVALLVYTALDRLARGLGPHQPWVLLPLEKLDDIRQIQPFDAIHFDVSLPEDMWRGHGEEDE